MSYARYKANLARRNRRGNYYLIIPLEIARETTDSIVTADGLTLPKTKAMLSKKPAVDGKKRVAVLESWAVDVLEVDPKEYERTVE